MDERSFESLCDKITLEVYDRKKGSFLRALWYGGRTEGFRGIPNSIISHLGGNGKGLRKVIRNAPRNLTAVTAGIAVGAPIVVFGTPAALPAAALAGELAKEVTKVAINAASGLVQSLATLIVDSVQEGISYTYIPGEESVYRRKITPRKKPIQQEEQLRKQLKHELKGLKKGLGLRILDRNLVKLKDAQHEIRPSVDLLSLLNDDNYTPESELYRATFSAMASVSETLHYTKKVKGLVANIKNPVVRLSENSLQPFCAHVNKVDQDLKNYIKAVVLKQE